MIHLSIFDNSFVIIILLVLFFALIALVVFLLRKHIPGLKDETPKPSTEEEAAKETLDRILVPIEDEVKNEEDNSSK